MPCKLSPTNKFTVVLVLCTILFYQCTQAQESTAELGSKSSYHNQLFFNRFLINPTFSLVRENKSYLNILHRNQYATFDDNSQNYFVGFSNKLNNRTALGIGVYSQWSGVIQEFGFNANYATSVRLGSKSTLTFGTNVTYFNTGLDKNRVVANGEDTELSDAQKESKIAIQPGITLSLGKFDFGIYAENLFNYNQSSNDFQTNLNVKSLRAMLQYSHHFRATNGFFKSARLMPLIQVNRNLDQSFSYRGSLLLDLPKYGWFQTALDDRFGLSMGLGFNLSKKMSLGYLMEKELSQQDADFGWNHELSLAYTFEDRNGIQALNADLSTDSKIDAIVRNYEEQILALTAEKASPKSKRKNRTASRIDEIAYQNQLILDQLILRQDSLEDARGLAFEQRFDRIVKILRHDIKQTIKANLNEATPKRNTALAVRDENANQKSQKEAFEYKKYEKLPIKVLNQADIIGVKSGYYVIANVYKNKKYLNAFMDALREQGLKAKKFYNTENGLYYVYLADFNVKQDAKAAFASNLNGKYEEEKWIMQVDNSTATAANIYEDEYDVLNRNE